MQSEELLEKAVKSAMLSVINEHPMGHWRDDQVKEVARRAIVEAALSAAKPVSSRNDEAGYVEFLNEDVPYIVRDMQGAVAILLNLETRNVVGYRVYDPDSVFAPPAPSVAVKALSDLANEIEKASVLLPDEIASRIRSALSAQVQDAAASPPAVSNELATDIIFHALVDIRGQPFMDTQIEEAMRECEGVWDRIKPDIAAPAKQEGGHD